MKLDGHKIKKVIFYTEEHYNLFFLLIFAVALFNIFCKITTLNINFDEARHGINAYEMLKNKNFIVNTYAYKNDYWNLKPPMSFWMVILGYKLFGFNMLGLRFFSCLCAVFTILLVGLFTKRKYGKFASLISLSIISTSTQFIFFHSARTGEADALYVLLFTLSVISVMMLHRGNKYLYLSVFFAALAFLTKSWHAFAALGVVGMYLIFSKKIILLKLKEWLLLVLSFIVPILLWVILRIQKDGFKFFSEMINYDLINRSAKSLEGHVGGPLYYFMFLFVYSGLWVVLLIMCLTIYFRNRRSKERIVLDNCSLALLLWFLVPILLYSCAKTKIDWYILPINPPLAIICGAVFSKFLKELDVKHAAKKVLAIGIVASILIYEGFLCIEIALAKNDSIEFALKQMGQSRKYSEYRIYTASGYYCVEGTWQQPHLLSAELWCDFKTINGGMDKFLEDTSPKTLLFVPSKDYDKNYLDKHNLKIIDSKNGYLLLSH